MLHKACAWVLLRVGVWGLTRYGGHTSRRCLPVFGLILLCKFEKNCFRLNSMLIFTKLIGLISPTDLFRKSLVWSMIGLINRQYGYRYHLISHNTCHIRHSIFVFSVRHARRSYIDRSACFSDADSASNDIAWTDTAYIQRLSRMA